jgi:hypothetical protein
MNLFNITVDENGGAYEDKNSEFKRFSRDSEGLFKFIHR